MTTDVHLDAAELLRLWPAPTPGQRALRESYLALLDARPDALQRSCRPGHLTASAVVLDPSGTATCLVHHKLVGAWLQPGGHLEAGESLADAALREAREETGLSDLVLDPVPLHLDVHPITCRGSGPTRHFDVRFLAVAPHRPPVPSEESHDVRWFPLTELPPLFEEVLELLQAARERLATTPPGGSR